MHPNEIVELVLSTAFEVVDIEKTKEAFALSGSTGLRRCSIFEQYSAQDFETMQHLARELNTTIDEIRANQEDLAPTQRKRRRSDGEDACAELVSTIRRRYSWNERQLLEHRYNKVPWMKISELLNQSSALLHIRYKNLLQDLWSTQKIYIATILFSYYRMDTLDK